MSDVTILSHFSTPNWPLANKLSMIAKCLEVGRIHCASAEKLWQVLDTQLPGRILFFTDEGMIEVVQEMDRRAYKNLEAAMFIQSPLSKVAGRISELKIVKYLLGGLPNESTGRDLSILIKKFTDGDILDLEKYLAFGCKIHTREVYDARSKKEAIEAVASYIADLGDPGYSHPYEQYSRIVCELTDELLLNAVFDANPRMRGIDRSQPFKLEAAEQIHMSWGYDGEYFGISVRDPFGKFACDTIMNYVAAQRKMETLAVSVSAGLGLKLIFEKAHKIITNVRKEKVTEVIALMNFRNRLLDYEGQKKSFYYFSDDDSEINLPIKK